MDETPRLFRDDDADLGHLAHERVAVLGYGNQGRSQALNLRDSGVDPVVGVPDDGSRRRAIDEGFSVADPAAAVSDATLCLVLAPDEALPALFDTLAGDLHTGQLLIFASGYAVAFDRVRVPEGLDLGLVAPRMFGPGVREHYLSGAGFPAFVAVERDATGRAWPRTLAVAKAVGATRAGCLELSFAQEAALDLFNEQAFGPAFGMVLTHACQTLVDAGFPPEAALLEILHSGEFAYALERMRNEGVIEQMEHHSRTSQYGAMSRAIRFLDLDLRPRMEGVLDDIQSGRFAREWAEEEGAGAPNLEKLRAARVHHPLAAWDRRTRERFGR